MIWQTDGFFPGEIVFANSKVSFSNKYTFYLNYSEEEKIMSYKNLWEVV